MKVFYNSKQSAKSNASSSPSAQKPTQVVQAWKESGVPFETRSFKPLSARQIALAHDPEYVRDVLACKRANGFGNRSKQIAATLPWTTGSMAAAAKHAFMKKEPTFSPTSGFHHAGFESSSGFCTFEGNVIAAILAQRVGARRVGIVDVDMHFGDGTSDILKHLKLDWIQHWSFGHHGIRCKDSEAWLRRFPKTLFTFECCDLIIYNAGVDSAITDPLGGVLTDEQLRLRDHYVYSTFAKLGIPVATSLAGGYETDSDGKITPVLRRHVATFEECYRANY